MQANKLYSKKIYEYFISQGYTEEEAKIIATGPQITCEKFVQLEQVKKLNEIIAELKKN